MKNLLLSLFLFSFISVTCQINGVDYSENNTLDSLFDRDLFVTEPNTMSTYDMASGVRNITLNGCYHTVENGCYEVQINKSTDITVKVGSKWIKVDSCHNIIINSGSELEIYGVSNRVYSYEIIDTIWITGFNPNKPSIEHARGVWRYTDIKPIPVPKCNY